MTGRFADIYDNNEWAYGSGVGSLPLNNVEYIRFLIAFMARNEIRSVVDFGCGDWQFSRFIPWNGVKYTGYDVVESVIKRNNSMFARDNISFSLLPPDTDFARADLILCKDVFQHLPNSLIHRYVNLFKARSRFALVTNDDWPGETATNADIEEGGWRPVRLDRAPFMQVAPVVLSWTVEWGGWKPTRKCTALLAGQ